MMMTLNFSEITKATPLLQKLDDTTSLLKSENATPLLLKLDDTTPLLKSENATPLLLKSENETQLKSVYIEPLIKSENSYTKKLRSSTQIFDDEFSCAVLMYHFIKIEYSNEDGFKKTLTFETLKFLI